LVGDCDGGKPGLCFANGLVADLFKPVAPVGLLKSLGSANPVGLGNMD
jgi:hypothetical protein